MDLIWIVGSGAVGKMTVGQELMKLTDFRLFHNHMMIEPVLEIFGEFNGQVVDRLREDIVDAFLQSGNAGMIFTYMWAFDLQSDWDYVRRISEKFEASGGTVYCVELVADLAVRLERNRTGNRLRHKASKRDLQLSEDRLLREEQYRLVSREGEIPFANYLRIDNTNLSPEAAARKIRDAFGLPEKRDPDLIKRVRLEEAGPGELRQLYAMQVESFLPLYQKYRDEGSPAIEPFEKVEARTRDPFRQYYFIVLDGARVGALNLRSKPDRNFHPVFWISPIFILPRYQNRGVGCAAIRRAFALHPEAAAWRLETILQEPANCRLYEKCGFVRTGGERVVQEGMTLIEYEKRCEEPFEDERAAKEWEKIWAELDKIM